MDLVEYREQYRDFTRILNGLKAELVVLTDRSASAKQRHPADFGSDGF